MAVLSASKPAFKPVDYDRVVAVYDTERERLVPWSDDDGDDRTIRHLRCRTRSTAYNLPTDREHRATNRATKLSFARRSFLVRRDNLDSVLITGLATGRRGANNYTARMRRTPLRKDKRQMADNTTPSFRVISFPVSLKVVARADVW